MHNTAKQN